MADPRNWDTAGNRRSDSKSPIRVLIETKDLSGERHAHGHEQEKYSYYPSEFARKLISAEEEDLHHVNEHNGYHEVRAPSVQSADEPTKSYVVIQTL